jgi:hypothetical protein
MATDAQLDSVYSLAGNGGPRGDAGRRERLSKSRLDNCWHTNFIADSHGQMEFQFDPGWRSKLDRPAAVAEALVSNAIIVAYSAVREETPILEHVSRP